MTSPSRSPAAFRVSLRDRLKTQAKQRGRPMNELEREFVLQRFLGRVFANADSPWILKGAAGLLIRLPGARHSRDLDLLHPSKHLDEAIKELAELAGRPGGDPFSFVLGTAVRMEGRVAGAQIKVDAYLGTTRFARFPIDLSTVLHLIARVARRQPRPVVEVPGVDALPEFTLYPLPDQVADKVCAMYEKHGAIEPVPRPRRPGPGRRQPATGRRRHVHGPGVGSESPRAVVAGTSGEPRTRVEYRIPSRRTRFDAAG